MIESVSRIGRTSAKIRPLRIQMCSELCRNMFLDAAYLLKNMKRKWPKLGISPDRAPDEIEHHRKLCKIVIGLVKAKIFVLMNKKSWSISPLHLHIYSLAPLFV